MQAAGTASASLPRAQQILMWGYAVLLVLLEKQEHIVLERSKRLNLDPKIRRRRNVLKEKMMFVEGK